MNSADLIASQSTGGSPAAVRSREEQSSDSLLPLPLQPQSQLGFTDTETDALDI